MRSQLTIAFVLLCFSLFGQSDLTLFSADGQAFILLVNGERINAQPASNVKATNLSGDGCKVKVLIDNISEVDKYLMLDPGKALVFEIRNNKGKYVLRLVSSSSREQVTLSTPTPSEVVVQTQEVKQEPGVQMTTKVTQTISETPVVEGVSGSESLSANISIGGVNAGISINVNDPIAIKKTQVITTTTEQSITETEPAQTKVVQELAASCSFTETQYRDALRSIESKAFNDTRISTAKTVLKGRCASVEQLMGMAKLIQFEEDRLDFIKYAYPFASNKDVFFRMGEILDYESSVEELNEFIQSRN